MLFEKCANKIGMLSGSPLVCAVGDICIGIVIVLVGELLWVATKILYIFYTYNIIWRKESKVRSAYTSHRISTNSRWRCDEDCEPNEKRDRVNKHISVISNNIEFPKVRGSHSHIVSPFKQAPHWLSRVLTPARYSCCFPQILRGAQQSALVSVVTFAIFFSTFFRRWLAEKTKPILIQEIGAIEIWHGDDEWCTARSVGRQ